jgi:alcohol dehydrogenase YqhD (iron-dependent ADH family)
MYIICINIDVEEEMKKIRSKHGNVFNYFACDHKDLSASYIRSCEKFFNSLGIPRSIAKQANLEKRKSMKS